MNYLLFDMLHDSISKSMTFYQIVCGLTGYDVILILVHIINFTTKYFSPLEHTLLSQKVPIIRRFFIENEEKADISTIFVVMTSSMTS